jgi:CRISPR system Cascade subunit CasA
MNFSFNLLESPWIPVLRTDGSFAEVGLADALIHAHEYRQISANLPHSNAAFYRLFLAILHRVYGPASLEDWEALYVNQRFRLEPLQAYLDQWRDRFDLFSTEHPFYQNRHPQVQVKPVNTLFFLTYGGDVTTLFDHSMDDHPLELSPAQAACALVTAQSFCLAGLANPQLNLFYTDAPCSRGANIFLLGKNLFETLMLNLVVYDSHQPIEQRGPDLPAWEMDNPYLPERIIPNGYLDYLTWQNRKIMLFPSQSDDGKVVIKQMTTAPGLTLSAEQRNPAQQYRVDEKTGTKLLRFSEGRGLWRDSSVLLDLEAKGQIHPATINHVNQLILTSNQVVLPRKLRLAAYGMCTDPGKAKVFFYRGEQFDFSNEILKRRPLVDQLNIALSNASECRSQLWGALRTLAGLFLTTESDQAEGKKPDPKDMDQMLSHWETEAMYWNNLEIPFHQFLDLLPDDPEKALEEWNTTVRHAATQAFDQTANGLGNSARVFKASAKARIHLLAGIKKIFTKQE